MQHPILDDRFTLLKDRFDHYLKELQAYIDDLEGTALAALVRDLRSGLNEPFLFVVVGEVKSGKSSFINALLDEDICPVDAAPCTDAIQEIVFAERPYEETLRPFLKKIGRPLPILQTIAIVDTPGTNTVIENHQEITRNFIPNSDLVLMVFQAKNPYTQSAWDLLDYIREDWRKRTVFILQQADLARPDEIETNMARVRDLAVGKGIAEPVIFATSAARELAGAAESGFEAVRRFIRNTVTGGRHYRLKLESILESIHQVLEQVDQALAQRRERFQADQAIVDTIRTRLESGHRQSAYEMRTLMQRMGEAYEGAAHRATDRFGEGLAVGRLFKKSLSATLGRKASVKGWLDDIQKQFEADLRAKIETLTEEGADHFLEGLRQLLTYLLDELDTVKGHRLNEDGLLRQIDRRRQDVIATVRTKMAESVMEEGLAADTLKDSDHLAPSLVGGSALTALGAFLLTVTHGLFFDITGGLLTGVGLFLAGGVLFIRKGRLVKQFRDGLAEGKQRFESELSERLSQRLELIYDDIDRNFLPLYDYVAQEEKRLAPLLTRLEDLRRIHAELAEAVRTSLEPD
jgi:GTPase Era involved in 16S rRNA processing